MRLSPIDVARLADVAMMRHDARGVRANPHECSALQLNTMGETPNHFGRDGRRSSRQCSGEFMKVFNSSKLIAAALVVAMPLGAFAGDKDKTPAPMGTVVSAQFDTLDTNRDGRISPVEASTDSKIEFTTADKNGDGYLDNTEYAHRDMAPDTMPEKTRQ
jgi:hypothetical protein